MVLWDSTPVKWRGDKTFSKMTLPSTERLCWGRVSASWGPHLAPESNDPNRVALANLWESEPLRGTKVIDDLLDISSLSSFAFHFASFLSFWKLRKNRQTFKGPLCDETGKSTNLVKGNQDLIFQGGRRLSLQTRLHSQLMSQCSQLSTVSLKLKCASESLERLVKTLIARLHGVSDSARAKNVHF